MSRSSSLKLSIRSDAAQLAPARKSVESFCAENGFSENAVGEIGLCLNEALANVIRHAYRGESDCPIEIEAKIESDGLHLKVRDWGEGTKPQLTQKVERDPMQPGGLGLICMGRLMDQVTFTPQSRGMLLEMLKKK